MRSDFGGNNDISFLVKNLDNLVQRYLHSLYQRKDFQECSLMNMWVCDFLFDNQERDVFQKDIEAEFFINRSTASKMLALMEAKQLIRRGSAEGDARLKRIGLLPKGYELHELCRDVRREIESKLSGNISAGELALFKSLCRQMIGNMES